MKKLLFVLMFVMLTLSSCIPNDEVTTKCFEAGRYVSCTLSAPEQPSSIEGTLNGTTLTLEWVSDDNKGAGFVIDTLVTLNDGSTISDYMYIYRKETTIEINLNIYPTWKSIYFTISSYNSAGESDWVDNIIYKE